MTRSKTSPWSSLPPPPQGMQLPIELPIDSAKIARMSLSEKQEFLYFTARNSGCREALEAWRRKDLLEILCLEMGKERKYTGVPKSRIIDHLLKLVSLKRGREDLNANCLQASLFSPEILVRRQRKGDCPSRLPVVGQISVSVDKKSSEILQLCRNAACKAQLSSEAPFCKRCSCYICHRFDDNKDPSLWIICSSDSLDGENECGLSCHIECALDQELAGVVHVGNIIELDGSYRCESCGRIRDLIGCWRKQLLIAKEARRVDILCHRLSLSHRLLNGTCRYKELHVIIDTATRKLESEVGSITEGSAKLVRGIVNRLSSGADVQNLIGFALEKVEDLLLKSKVHTSEPNIQGGNMSRFSTKDAEVIPRADEQQVSPANKEEGMVVDVDNEVAHLTSDLTTNFKVRDLEKVLHPVCIQDQQPSGVLEDMVGVDEHAGPALNVLLSPLPDTSSIEDEGCKPRQFRGDVSIADGGACNTKHGGTLCRLNQPADLNARSGEGRVTIATRSVHTPAVKATTKTDSTELIKEKHQMKCSKQALLDCVKAEAAEVSDPSNSDTARGEEIDVVSPLASGSLQANAISKLSGIVRADDFESNGHGQSWAVQIRNGGTSMEMEPQSRLVKKRTVAGSERPENCYSLINRRTAVASATSICAAKSYEFCVKIIRWLECEGHLKEDFRMKFLTWFSLRATDHEKRVVSVFIDTLQDNPTSLAEQLVDTFDDIISVKRQQVAANGFCNTLWH